MDDKQREAFEAWVQGRNVCKKYGARIHQNRDGSYKDYRINDRWVAWQAALSHAEGEAVGEITIDKHGDAHFRASQGYLDLDQGTYDLYTHPAPQVAVPEGWKLVPKVPTDAMLEKAQRDWLGDPMRRSSTLWSAMLAAAPTAPAVVWVQPPFSYEEYEQANGRVIRNGQRGDIPAEDRKGWPDYNDNRTEVCGG